VTTTPFQVWTDGTGGTPVCAFTQINLTAASAANDNATENDGTPIDEYLNGNLARESVSPAGTMGILTGEYPDFFMNYYTREGAALLMQNPVWNPGDP
jgi:hypothetical protein